MNEYTVIGTSFVAIMAGLLGIAAKLISLGYSHGALTERVNNLSKLSERVDFLYSLMLSRGKVEAIEKGWGTLRSQFKITTAGIEAVMPLLGKFMPWYRELLEKHPGIREAQIFEAFERTFGQEIIERICVPLGVSNLACLVAVMEACKEEVNRA